jgi:hypothetical protein
LIVATVEDQGWYVELQEEFIKPVGCRAERFAKPPSRKHPQAPKNVVPVNI